MIHINVKLKKYLMTTSIQISQTMKDVVQAKSRPAFSFIDSRKLATDLITLFNLDEINKYDEETDLLSLISNLKNQ